MKTSAQVYVAEFSIWNIVVDVFLIGLCLSSTGIMVNHIPPYKRGFFCNDETIRYPYKSSTVEDGYLYGFSTSIAILTMTAMELWLAWSDAALRRRVALVAGRAVPEWVFRLLRHVLLFGYGLGCQELLINVGKFTVGRLRPHFLAVCRPNVTCNASTAAVYIQDYECTGVEGFDMFQTRLSFPSGHSAVSFYAAVFVVLYMERRIQWPERTIVMKTAFQVLVITLAWFTALSRIQDKKHHWEDVTVGSILGILIALFYVRKVLHVSADEGQSSGASETTFVFATDSLPLKQ